MTFLKDSEVSCESPLCDVRFPQTGLKMECFADPQGGSAPVPLGKDKAWQALDSRKGGTHGLQLR
jgi:hypothetical protein